MYRSTYSYYANACTSIRTGGVKYTIHYANNALSSSSRIDDPTHQFGNNKTKILLSIYEAGTLKPIQKSFLLAGDMMSESAYNKKTLEW